MHGSALCQPMRIQDGESCRCISISQSEGRWMLACRWCDEGGQEEGLISSIDSWFFLQNMKGFQVSQTFMISLPIDDGGALDELLS